MEPFTLIKTKTFINNFKQKIKDINGSHSPSLNKCKYLIIVACHLDIEIKSKIIQENYEKMKYENCEFIIVYSKNQPFNHKLHEYTFERTTLLEIENDSFLDFSKWVYALNQPQVQDAKYDFIVFTNDSYYLTCPIPHFFNLCFTTNTDFYAFTSSSEKTYHYQSFLFSLKASVIPKFLAYVNHFIEKKNEIKHRMCVLEISLYSLFSNKDCLLDIGNLDLNTNKNIFFHNPELYSILLKQHILPIVKLKIFKNRSKVVKQLCF